ncbi:MAG: addiction module toxin, HicA family [Cyanobacteria bacterium]|nr:addiction module toxin, HicA family [Cyanobacteria bacterium GSL.Bin21]
MKRKDLIKRLEKEGCQLLRHGSKHDLYHNPKTGRTQPVPRHREINEILAKKILKDLTEAN